MQSVMLDMEGIMVLCEGVPNESIPNESVSNEIRESASKEEGKKHWWKDGVDVSIRLKRSALEQLVADMSFLQSGGGHP